MATLSSYDIHTSLAYSLFEQKQYEDALLYACQINNIKLINEIIDNFNDQVDVFLIDIIKDDDVYFKIVSLFIERGMLTGDKALWVMCNTNRYNTANMILQNYCCNNVDQCLDIALMNHHYDIVILLSHHNGVFPDDYSGNDEFLKVMLNAGLNVLITGGFKNHIGGLIDVIIYERNRRCSIVNNHIDDIVNKQNILNWDNNVTLIICSYIEY